MGKRFGAILLLIVWALSFSSCHDETNKPNVGQMQLVSVRVGTYTLVVSSSNAEAPADQSIVITFAAPVDPTTVADAITLSSDDVDTSLTFSFLDNNKTISAKPIQELEHNRHYTLMISNQLRGSQQETFEGISVEFTVRPDALTIISMKIGEDEITGSGRITDVPLDLSVAVTFSAPLLESSISNTNIQLTGVNAPSLNFQLDNDNNILIITGSSSLKDLTKYTFTISDQLKGSNQETFEGLSKDFYTGPDPDPKFEVIPDDELLTLVQQQTFKYFWDFAQPNSGMARERNTSGDLVTTGGSGFGIMALIVGMERGFITRQEGLDRMDKILTFLESADRFHGAWSHWINGNTGEVIPFSANDNGGDLVETSYLIQGLLTFRQYLDKNVAEENALIDRINSLWESVEWDWYTQGGQDKLYWHWSPDKGWIMNFPIRGYNEALITYVLAASSPDHSINKTVYTSGWAQNGDIVNGKSFYGITLPVGYDFGGPLFFAHYSFLGIDPTNLSDAYANYWTQNVNHTLINRQHCIVNPNDYVAYSENCWGLTACDGDQGYSAFSPTNDKGVIAPTAALSSFPYTPDESMDALKFFYYTIGDRMWGPYGFHDAFNITAGWYADSYLAIDEGPIIVMIENYRTQLLWDLFMSCPEVQGGLTKLGFTY